MLRSLSEVLDVVSSGCLLCFPQKVPSLLECRTKPLVLLDQPGSCVCFFRILLKLEAMGQKLIDINKVDMRCLYLTCSLHIAPELAESSWSQSLPWGGNILKLCWKLLCEGIILQQFWFLQCCVRYWGYKGSWLFRKGKAETKELRQEDLDGVWHLYVKKRKEIQSLNFSEIKL